MPQYCIVYRECCNSRYEGKGLSNHIHGMKVGCWNELQLSLRAQKHKHSARGGFRVRQLGARGGCRSDH